MIEISDSKIQTVSKWLKVIAEPNRLLILNKIIQGVQCNCELGDALQMAPNLISHHLGVLRETGLVDVERDPIDARWVYYSINLKALMELTQVFGTFFDPERIQPRTISCGPRGLIVYHPSEFKLEE